MTHSPSKPVLTLGMLSDSLSRDTHSDSAQPDLYKGLFGALGEEAQALSFYLPEDGQLASLALSLLKFDFPPNKSQHTLARFVTQLLATPRTSKRHLQKLPWPALEWLAQQLCLRALHEESLAADDLSVQLWLLFEELSEFGLEALVKGDIQALGQEEFSRLHSYYYQSRPDLDILGQILITHGFDQTPTGAGVAWLAQSQEAAISDKRPHNDQPNNDQQHNNQTDRHIELLKAYWCVRRLGFPLPWASILRKLQSDNALWRRLCDSNPFIAHLVRRLSLEKQVRFASERLTYQDVAQRLAELETAWFNPLPLSFESPGGNSGESSGERSSECAVAEFDEKKRDDTDKIEPGQIRKSRETLWSKRPYQRLILVEGNTEAILLPLLARICHLKRFGDRPEQEAWQTLQQIRHTLVMPVGGKNQMAATYKTLCDELRVPISVLLDADAALAWSQVNAIVRKQPADALLMIGPDNMTQAQQQARQGEIEDLYPQDLLLCIINETYTPYPPLTSKRYKDIVTLCDPALSHRAGVRPPVGKVAELKLVWQTLELGRFDKVALAQEVASRLASVLISPSDQARRQKEWQNILPEDLERLVGQLYGLPLEVNAP